MATDLRIVLPDRPGTGTAVCEALAAAGINLEGICGDLRPGEGWGYLHVAIEDDSVVEDAVRAVESTGCQVVDVHAVDLIPAQNQPGELVKLLGEYRDRGENLEVLYVASDNRIVIGTEAQRKPRHGVRVDQAKYSERPPGL
ncbi:MAG TPA: hypothetical protein VJ927_01335 [Actinomycetota bacterium]|nr:hypothetical protein [Actinomycetota bacterium]